MKKLFYVLLFPVFITISVSCRKDANTSTLIHSCLDFIVSDSSLQPSGMILKSHYIFNANNKLEKLIIYDGSGTGIVSSDSFTYENGNMIKSFYSLDGIHTYTTSEYDYSGDKLIKSRYYLGNTLIVHSSYVTDISGKLVSYSQFSDNLSYQSLPSYTYTFKYDNNSNLLSITNSNDVALVNFSNYDNHPNPFYNLPFDFAYEPWPYSVRSFSKNNSQLTFVNSPTAPENATYLYTYDTNGKVLTATSGRYVPLPGALNYRNSFQYKCE